MREFHVDRILEILDPPATVANLAAKIVTDRTLIRSLENKSSGTKAEGVYILPREVSMLPKIVRISNTSCRISALLRTGLQISQAEEVIFRS